MSRNSSVLRLPNLCHERQLHSGLTSQHDRFTTNQSAAMDYVNKLYLMGMSIYVTAHPCNPSALFTFPPSRSIPCFALHCHNTLVTMSLFFVWKIPLREMMPCFLRFPPFPTRSQVRKSTRLNKMSPPLRPVSPIRRGTYIGPRRPISAIYEDLRIPMRNEIPRKPVAPEIPPCTGPPPNRPLPTPPVQKRSMRRPALRPGPAYDKPIRHAKAIRVTPDYNKRLPHLPPEAPRKPKKSTGCCLVQ